MPGTANGQFLLFSAWSAVAVPPAPPGLFASSYRAWITGTVPPWKLGVGVLPAPTVHDVPHPPVTLQGQACPKQVCREAHRPGAPWLWYYPSGQCVACWERADKRTTDYVPSEEEESC